MSPKEIIEKEAADALLDVGISFPLIRVKIPFIKAFYIKGVMKRPKLGSLIRIAKIYLSMGVTVKDMELFTKEQEFEFIANHGHKVAMIAALSILRGTVKGYMFGWLLKWVILLFISDAHLYAIGKQFTPLFGTKSFINIIRSVEIANPLTPRLSQNVKKGS